MKKTISLTGIQNKSRIRFFCQGNADFSQRKTHILIYFNDFPIPFYDVHAEILILKEPLLNTFDLDIPSASSFATIIITTPKKHLADLVMVVK